MESIRGRSSRSRGSPSRGSPSRGSPLRSRGKSVKRLKNIFIQKIGAKITSMTSQESCDESGDNASNSRMEGSSHDGNVDVDKSSCTSENNDEEKMPSTPPREGTAALTAPMLAKFTSRTNNSSLSLSPLRLSIFQNSLQQPPSSESGGGAFDMIKQSFESNKDDELDEMIIEQIDSGTEDHVAADHHQDDVVLHREEE
eukprot:scaffold17436_cov176-Skeletonema_marinoi.AAC.1